MMDEEYARWGQTREQLMIIRTEYHGPYTPLAIIGASGTTWIGFVTAHFTNEDGSLGGPVIVHNNNECASEADALEDGRSFIEYLSNME